MDADGRRVLYDRREEHSREEEPNDEVHESDREDANVGRDDARYLAQSGVGFDGRVQVREDEERDERREQPGDARDEERRGESVEVRHESPDDESSREAETLAAAQVTRPLPAVILRRDLRHGAERADEHERRPDAPEHARPGERRGAHGSRRQRERSRDALRPRVRQSEDVAERRESLNRKADEHGSSGAEAVENRPGGRVQQHPGEAVDGEDDADGQRRKTEQRAESGQRREGDAAADAAEEDARDEAENDGLRVVVGTHSAITVTYVSEGRFVSRKRVPVISRRNRLRRHKRTDYGRFAPMRFRLP